MKLASFRSPMRRARAASAAAALSLAFALYGASAPTASAEAASDAALLEKIAGLRIGEMRDLEAPSEIGAPLEVAFLDEAGAETSLEAYRGRVVLLNFWATWCAPCLKELPSIDRLAGEVDAEQIAVLALNVDRGDTGRPAKFFETAGIENLALIRDPEMAVPRQLALLGMPTTILIDRRGREIARYLGDAEWDAAEVKTLLEAIATAPSS